MCSLGIGPSGVIYGGGDGEISQGGLREEAALWKYGVSRDESLVMLLMRALADGC